MRATLWPHLSRRSLMVGLLLLAQLAIVSGCGSVDQSPDIAKLLAAAIEGSGPFCLTTEFQPLVPQDETTPTTLARELSRQAVLIAARDGLGLATRDETLSESFPADEKARRGPYELLVRKQDGTVRLNLRVPNVGAENAPLQLFELEFDCEKESGELYTSQAKALAAAAYGEMVDQLRQAGFEGKSVLSDPHGALPDGVESQLQKMDVVAQYDAVRRLHYVIAERGESPARLGGLVRAYANLGLLTQHHWSSAYAAFAARSLLYSERLMTVSDAAPLAYQHRAYARALAGLPAAALADLAHEPVAEAEQQPSWLSVLTPYVDFQRDALLATAVDPEVEELANVLAFQLNSCYADERWNIAAGQQALKVCPDAYGIYSELANHTPMLVQRQSVAAVADAIGRRVPANVARVEGLPEPAVQLLSNEGQPSASWLGRYLRGDRESRAWSTLPHQIADALREQCKVIGDSSEPSWGVLATLIDDEQFVAIVDYLNVSMNAVEYSKEDLVNQLAPLVEGHPYQPYINSFALGRGRSQSESAAFASQMKVRDPRPQMCKMLQGFWDFSDANGQTYCNLYNHSLWAADLTFPAMFVSLNTVSDTWWTNEAVIGQVRPWATELQAITPKSPTTLRLEIQITTKPSPEQLSEWEGRAVGDPLALRRIGKIYNDQNNFESAARCLDKSYSLSPAYETAISLADAYRAAGKEDQWLPALENYLKEQDYALGHALIHQKIANDLIGKNMWAEAEPHAAEAAQTWSAWGLTLAGQVYEGLGRWDESEKWYREAVDSYPTYCGHEWYFWCCRTGRGDRVAARKAFDAFLELDWVKNRQSGENYIFVDKMLSGDYQQTLDELQAHADFDDNHNWRLHAMLLAKRTGNDQLYAELTDALVAQIDQQYGDSDPNLPLLVSYIKRLQQQGSLSAEDHAAVDKLFEQFGPISRTNYCYFFGEQLAAHGDVANAEKYWRQSLDAGQNQKYNATFSGHRLAQLHETSRPDDYETQKAKEEAEKNSL